MPFCVAVAQSAWSKSNWFGEMSVQGLGSGPKEPCIGVRLSGLRMMLPSPFCVVCGRIGELMATCDVFVAFAIRVQRDWSRSWW